jgi:predicted RNase H-like HicB family nuclease
MEIPVLIERVKGNGFRARGAEPFAVSARGATRDEALAKLRTKIQTRLKNGTELVALEVGSQPRPWMVFAGMFKESPLFDEVLQIMEENRKADDADPDYL